MKTNKELIEKFEEAKVNAFTGWGGHNIREMYESAFYNLCRKVISDPDTSFDEKCGAAIYLAHK